MNKWQKDKPIKLSFKALILQYSGYATLLLSDECGFPLKFQFKNLFWLTVTLKKTKNKQTINKFKKSK